MVSMAATCTRPSGSKPAADALSRRIETMSGEISTPSMSTPEREIVEQQSTGAATDIEYRFANRFDERTEEGAILPVGRVATQWVPTLRHQPRVFEVVAHRLHRTEPRPIGTSDHGQTG